MKLPTISAYYISQCKLLHKQNTAYGTSALKHLNIIKKLYKTTGANSLLDYGCGKGMLAKNLDFLIQEYDPAIEGKDSPPTPADLVVCIDVLEHIEPRHLDATLQDIARCTLRMGYFTISTRAAVKVLPNGRNTHFIQKGNDWWTVRIARYFHVPKNGIVEEDKNISVIVFPKRIEKLKELFND